MSAPKPLDDDDYATLAVFRHALRRFMAISEEKAAEFGLTPQQHQALLAIRAAPQGSASVGFIAERLIMKPHSATGLIDRLETLNLVRRQPSAEDGRRTILVLTDRAEAILLDLSATHRDEIRRLKPLISELLSRL
jgi:DNA-binding MarR family transcriptional regulator